MINQNRRANHWPIRGVQGHGHGLDQSHIVKIIVIIGIVDIQHHVIDVRVGHDRRGHDHIRARHPEGSLKEIFPLR